MKGTSAKWAKANLFSFPASHQSYRKEKGSECHVSWLLCASDSISDVIPIVSKLKRGIYEMVTQNLLENRSKRARAPPHWWWDVPETTEQTGAKAGSAQHCWWCCWGQQGHQGHQAGLHTHPTGSNRGKQRVQFGAGTSSYEMVLSGRNDGQTQFSWEIAWLADGWTAWLVS